MTYSEISITFNVDYEIGFDVFIIRSLSGVNTSETWEWVATRSAAFEVTEGTPTGTAGETAAINFKAAFDLDHPTGFVTTQTLNTVVIASETEGEDFIGFKSNNGLIRLTNGVEYDVAFDNFSDPVNTSNIDLALVRSPHYVSTNFNFETTTKATIDVTIWSGDLSTIPATPTYTLTRLKPIISAITLDTNLSEIIRSQLIPEPNIGGALPLSAAQLLDSETSAVKWVYYNVTFTDNVEIIPNIEGTFSALDGYGYYNQNANPGKPSNRILSSNIGSRKVDRNGIILIPFVNDGTYTSVDVVGDNLGIDSNFVITQDDESSHFIKYVVIDCNQTTDTVLTITFNGILSPIFTINIVDECRYNPKTILFKNKYGAFETVSMFKKSTSSISTSKEDFVNQFVTNINYDTTRHQFKNINFEATEKITLNSGYISEDENETYKQLLLSDQVWFYNGGDLIPVNLDTNDLTFKNRVNDKLVNYSIDFKYAYNTIQNV
jgi:hypothetical protein